MFLFALHWAPGPAVTEAGGLFQVSAMVGTTELTISATDKNLAALPELPKVVERQAAPWGREPLPQKSGFSPGFF